MNKRRTETARTDQKKIIAHFKKYDPIIHHQIKKIDFKIWVKSVQPNCYFYKLCQEIIGQQLSGKAAETIINRFLELFPGGTLTPQSLIKVPDQTLRNVGMSWAKVSYVKNIASAFNNNEINAQNLHIWPDEEVITHLTAIKGVGRWTAEMFLMFSLGRENVFSHGDLGLKRGIEKLYKLNNPSKKQIEQIIAPWSPYKSYGSYALWQSLENR